MIKEKFENLPVKTSTKEMVDALGGFKESYDDVIKRLIKSYSLCTCVTSQESSSSVGARLVEENRKKEGWGK